MSITLQKNKLSAVVFKGNSEDLQIFSESIERGINYYLCQPNFSPIMREQAESIYFLKWLNKCICLESVDLKGNWGNIVVNVPKQDLSLVQSFQDALDRVLMDLLNSGSEQGLSIELSEACYFLTLVRKALTPSLSAITKDIRNSLFN